MSEKTTVADEMNAQDAVAKDAGQQSSQAPASEMQFDPETFSELMAKAAKAEENWEKFVRATADLDNFRKRAARERDESRRYANEDLLQRLIPVVDNFEAALSATSNAEGANLESLKTGVSMICSQLRMVLRDAGLEEINATGQPFDPALHEAVSQQETADVPEEQVVQQLRRGYKLRDRLLRPAGVIVAKKPAA